MVMARAGLLQPWLLLQTLLNQHANYSNNLVVTQPAVCVLIEAALKATPLLQLPQHIPFNSILHASHFAVLVASLSPTLAHCPVLVPSQSPSTCTEKRMKCILLSRTTTRLRL